MYINKKKVYGYYNEDRYDESGWWWERMISMGGAHFENLEEVKKDLEAIDTLIESNFNKINDNDFYCLLSRIYSINLTLKDMFNIMSRVGNIYYDKIELLNTKQTFDISRQKGHGKDLDCLTDKYQVRWIVATAKNFNLNTNYNYSEDEIKNMMSNKQIVAISMYPKKLGTGVKLPYKEEKFKELEGLRIECDSNYVTGQLYSYNFNNPGYFNDFFDKLGIDFYYFKEGKNDFSKKIYKEACSMIRMRLNKEQVLKDCKQIVLFLENEVGELSPRIQESYFCVYSDKDKYLNLAKEITDINNALLLKFKNRIEGQDLHKVLRRSI